jgi:predicted MFS family arabinose efflux permease/HAMP domain-containing protein
VNAPLAQSLDAAPKARPAREADAAEAGLPLAGFFAAALALLVVASVTAAALMLWTYQERLAPELDRKAAAIGRSVAGQIERAVALGIPLEDLAGMEPFLRQKLDDNADLVYVAVRDRAGRILYAAGLNAARGDAAGLDAAERSTDARPVSVQLNEGRLGLVDLGIDPDTIERQARAMLFDVAIVILVAVVIAAELLMLFTSVALLRPTRILVAALSAAANGDLSRRVEWSGRDEVARACTAWNGLVQRLSEGARQLVLEADDLGRTLLDPARVERVRRIPRELAERFRFAGGGEPPVLVADPRAVRAPLFVFMFAEEMSRAFLPSYVKSLYAPLWGLAPDVVVGLPITVFMAVLALVMLVAGRWVDRIGVRRMYVFGMAPALLGYTGMAFAQSVPEVMACRALSAAGYALIHIASQGYVADASDPRNRTRAMAIFMGAIYAAMVCGPALGGILADQIGIEGTFLISAGLTALSATLMVWLVAGLPERQGPPRRGLKLHDLPRLLANPGFAALVFLAAIPGKLIQAGFLFFLAPLALAGLGNTPSEIGRIIMIYGACTVILSPSLAEVADRWGAPAAMAALGGVVAGVGLVPAMAIEGTWPLVVAVLMVGIGQAAAIAPQLAAVPHFCPRECIELGQPSVLAAFRFLERLGSIAGPLLAASLMARFGIHGAIVGLGAVGLVGGLAFLALHRRLAPRVAEAAP